jgi:hypothetical protein
VTETMAAVKHAAIALFSFGPRMLVNDLAGVPTVKADVAVMATAAVMLTVAIRWRLL